MEGEFRRWGAGEAGEERPEKGEEIERGEADHDGAGGAVQGTVYVPGQGGVADAEVGQTLINKEANVF